ncbi:MAG: exopolysaccharide biosynthesis polyprenyl glycosylphosphotransferase [bacterium]|nr:exopolysaccharide biosynthesis polyprenyl glycosylphosphotransferase [bacterium]
MNIVDKKETLMLFLGDVFIFLFSLWLMLLVRYFELPTWEVFSLHLWPFSLLFAAWFVVFYIAGLYESQTVLFKNKLPTTLFNAELANSILAVAFFYFVPYFVITPKTNLFIALGLSFILILIWRIYGAALLGVRVRQNAIIIGSGGELRELKSEVNHNSRYSIKFLSFVDASDIQSIDFQEDIVKKVYTEQIAFVAVDLHDERIDPLVPHLYNLIFSGVQFMDMHKMYEEIFYRVPLSLVKYNWFLENISHAPRSMYDFLKRLMDILIALVLGAVSLLVYPLVCLLIKAGDGGPIFIKQERIGKNNKPLHIIKFRTMTTDDHGDYEKNVPNEVTPVGVYLRRFRIDELPQLWNVLRGDLSLIGPRPELPALVRQYESHVPYYNIRHLIKPGLSGWAQIYHREHPHHAKDVEETKVKLSYDLYYIKNRSFMLDVKIALKTLKVLMLRSGV